MLFACPDEFLKKNATWRRWAEFIPRPNESHIGACALIPKNLFMDVQKDEVQRDPDNGLLDGLLPELISLILGHVVHGPLGIPDVLRFAATCRLAREMVLNDASLWAETGKELDFLAIHGRSPPGRRPRLERVNGPFLRLLSKLPPQFLANLEVLGLEYCCSVTLQALNPLLDRCTSLRSLSVVGCSGIIFPDEGRLAQLISKLARRGCQAICLAGTRIQDGIVARAVTSTLLDGMKRSIELQPLSFDTFVRFQKCKRAGCWLPLHKESPRPLENACPACGLVETVCAEASFTVDRMRCLIRCSDCKMRCSPCDCQADKADPNRPNQTTLAFGNWCRNPLCSSFICTDCADITRSTQRGSVYCSQCVTEMLHYGVSQPMDLLDDPDFGYA